ncbi:MAG TPA: MerR family transcriptional regulator [Pseudobdellovibrionaceae bacterium]|nr:MerR family transcriptional regulator [Pseudobdellovibrionaceae bacterium]
MLSIGQFAEMAQVSARTVRYYESIGLLPRSSRGENNYRYYDQKWIVRMNRIRDLQSLGFRLEDIKTVINFSNSELRVRLNVRLLEIDQEMFELGDRRERVLNLLSVSNKIETGEILTKTERNLYMESIREEIIEGLKKRYNKVTDSTLAYLKRDDWINNHPQVGTYLDAVKKCIEFAKQKNLMLGTARGSAPASLTLYGLGFSGVDPLKYEMIPERLSTQNPFFHIDVEFDRGLEFVDFCREVNRTLSYGEIQAFKMPLIDIVQGVHKSIGKVINYDAIDDDSDLVLNPFRNAEIEKIFQFDFSEDALVMSFERYLPEYVGLQKMTEYLKDQKIYNFRDIINISALWRPHCNEMVERIDLYKSAKSQSFSYGFLSESIENSLKPNFGRIIYHEDLLRIISENTGWDFARSNALRRLGMRNTHSELRDQNPEWLEFKKLAPKEIVDLVAEESKWSFCLPHAISFANFTKQTAILKSLYKEVYFTEIEKFEQKQGVTWDDIGIRMKGVSLHQG